MTMRLPEGCTREDVLVHLDYLEDALGLSLPPDARDLVRGVRPSPTMAYPYKSNQVPPGFCWCALEPHQGSAVKHPTPSILGYPLWRQLAGSLEQKLTHVEPACWKTYRTAGEAWGALVATLLSRKGEPLQVAT